MSSAEDTTPLTASPSASSTASPEEFRVAPSPGTDSAPASSTPVGQTPDEPGEGDVPEAKTKPLPKGNAVAHEVRIKVTGARPIDNAIDRELFTEDTTTVLVFEKGGIIRLVAAVAPGQLLFLTNEESKREVVAQVVRKRTYRPTECYVELEFTEPAPKFWGMEFSAAAALLPKDAKLVEAAELIASAETSEDDPVHAAPAPSAEQIQALRKEIEALRGQLSSLQTQATAPPQPVPAAAPPESLAPPQSAPAEAQPAPMPPPTLVEALSMPAPGSGKVEEIAPAWMPAPQTHLPSSDFEPAVVPQAASLPSPTQELAEATQSAFQSLPRKPAPPREPAPLPIALTPAEHAMLPQPSLDFSASLPKKRKRSFRAKGNFTPGFRTGMLRLTLLSMALVVTIIGAAWYKHWLPWKPATETKRIEVSSWAGSVSAAPPPSGVAVNPAATAGNGKAGSPGSSGGAPQNSSAANGSAGDTVPEGPYIVEHFPVVAAPSGDQKPTPAATVSKRSPGRPTAPAKVEAAPVSNATGGVVPARLIKSARAVASLEDLRDFETGAVIIDAIVDTNGNISAMNVLSGPPSLRDPAMAALRDYKYDPATRNGVPVPSHVTVRIQFHFE